MYQVLDMVQTGSFATINHFAKFFLHKWRDEFNALKEKLRKVYFSSMN